MLPAAVPIPNFSETARVFCVGSFRATILPFAALMNQRHWECYQSTKHFLCLDVLNMIFVLIVSQPLHVSIGRDSST